MLHLPENARFWYSICFGVAWRINKLSCLQSSITTTLPLLVCLSFTLIQPSRNTLGHSLRRCCFLLRVSGSASSQVFVDLYRMCLCSLSSADPNRRAYQYRWRFVIFTIFTITTFIFSYSLSISFWTQDLAFQQILFSIDLFLSYRTNSTDSWTI